MFIFTGEKQNKTKRPQKSPPRATALFYDARSYCYKRFADMKLRQVAVVTTVWLKNSRRYLNPERTGKQKTKTN